MGTLCLRENRLGIYFYVQTFDLALSFLIMFVLPWKAIFFIFSSLECVLFVDHHLCVRRGLDAAQSAKFWKTKAKQRCTGS